LTPEAQEHLTKAREELGKARNVLDRLNYADEAGRLAYLAAFHAAQALIAERTSRTAKTHAGVHSQFHLLIRDDDRFAMDLRRFLSDAFDLKTVSDYGVGPNATVSSKEAEAAIATATRFVDRIEEILDERPH
jgi:uncharacterized protein (UPF0332 family)